MLRNTDSLLAIAEEIQHDRRQQADRHRLVRQARQARCSRPAVAAVRSSAPAPWRAFRRLKLLASSGS
jgi:hypothetical protein